MTASQRFKKHLIDLERKRVGVHPAPRTNMLLNRNERIVPHESPAVKALQKKLAKVPLNLYPDLELFYKKISAWLGVDESQVYITEGVSGAIKSLIETIASPKDTILFPVPTFALYPVYCRMFDVKYKTVGYKKGYKLDVEGLLRAIDKDTAIVFLPNPNVPIEGTLGLRQIRRIAEHCAKFGTFLVMDEVYYPFGGPTAIGLIKEFDNIFIMRSFSKAFGLAGIRLGYLVGAKHNIDYVSKTRTGYETNSLSASVASFFIENDRFAKKYIKEVRDGLDFLKNEFDRLGLPHNGGITSNFIYVDLGDDKAAEKMARCLKGRNIHVRGGWPKPFSAGLAVTGGPKRVMRIFMKEFSSILDDIKDGR